MRVDEMLLWECDAFHTRPLSAAAQLSYIFMLVDRIVRGGYRVLHCWEMAINFCCVLANRVAGHGQSVAIEGSQ